ncbi:MAG: hypothetical protein FWC58_03220 [Desulfobulbus sp.]|nr:hypothetical protein [Desulfobulbus sp.]
MNKLKAYLQAQLQSFDRGALWSPQILKEGCLVMACWSIPAIAIVCLVALYREHIPSIYLEAAISEGIGPHLWNVIGTLALLLVGLAFLFPRSKLIAKSAHQVLINTYAIGGLSFGLLFGQLAMALVSASANVTAWKVWFMGGGSVFLAILALSLNFSLWYLGHLMASREERLPQGERNCFLRRVERVDLRLRVAAFTLFAVLPVAFLFMER